MNELKIVRDFFATCAKNAKIQSGRSFSDFFQDRVSRCCSQKTLALFSQEMMNLLQASPGDWPEVFTVDHLKVCNDASAPKILEWIRQNSISFTALVFLKNKSEADDIIDEIKVDEVRASSGACRTRPKSEIEIQITLTSPMSHGSDQKMGNSTGFRRRSCVTDTGSVLQLPYYAGNAFRGQMRDMLADHWTESLGITVSRSKPKWALWFFHAIYAGGALQEKGQNKKLEGALGNNGAIRSDGIRELRDSIPMINLLGAAMGNRIISGHAMFGDLRPVCREWGNGGELSADELTEWLYLTRREDHEEHVEHHGMIANIECLRAGTMLEGGIDLGAHTSSLSRSCLGRGLELMTARGLIGANNRQGYGKCIIEHSGATAGSEYQEWIESNKSKIIDYLMSIEAIQNELL